LVFIKNEIEEICLENFTTVLLNLYRDGKDSNGWHADNEKELGKNPVIASVSFGAERAFHLQHNSIKDAKQKIILEHGSLLLMKGTTQHFWKHQIPKTKKPIDERINLTFRIIK
jgi:alkylated DNA repair dioxygenase AlkB